MAETTAASVTGTAGPVDVPAQRDGLGPGGRRHVRVAVVGSGFGGLGMAIRLKQAGEHDFVVLERASDLGGTWRDNSYPGCACDVPSDLYSFSFAPNPDWSSTYSGHAEIHAYLKGCARRFDVERHVRYGAELLDSAWDEQRQRWVLTTAAGGLTADVLVLATGPLSQPKLPDVAGIESFRGTTFHSAQWDHEHDLTGERVAVVGTGASAIQFVPEVQKQAGHLTVFMRTPPWILPRPDEPTSQRRRELFRRVPLAQAARRGLVYARQEALFATGLTRNNKLLDLVAKQALQHLEESVADPELRAKLTPDYRIGCKRVLVANDFYPAVSQSNVDVVASPVVRVEPTGVVTADGTLHEVDTIVFGTGFTTTDIAVAHRVRGRDGALLSDVWAGTPQAYLGISVAGFPNMYLLAGPNTATGHTSVVHYIEFQVKHVLGALRHMAQTGTGALEVRPEVQAAFFADLQRRMARSVWTNGGCGSWYLNEQGLNTTLWPGWSFELARLSRRFDPAAYVAGARRLQPVGAWDSSQPVGA